MEHATTTPIDPVNLDAQGLERFIVGPDMSTAAGTAHADRGWMLAQDQDRPPLFAQFVDDATLKLLDLREVDQPQHINFQRRQLRGWPHRQSIYRQIMGRNEIHRLQDGSRSHSLYTPKTPSGKCRSSRHEECLSDPKTSSIFGSTIDRRPFPKPGSHKEPSESPLPAFRLIGDQPNQLDFELGSVGESEVNAHSKIIAAGSEHEMEGVDDGWPDHAWRQSPLSRRYRLVC